MDHQCAVGNVDFGDLEAAVAQPSLHQVDLVALRADDPLAHRLHVGAGVVPRGEAAHEQRLGMVPDHSGHEADVALVVVAQHLFGALPIDRFELGDPLRVGARGGRVRVGCGGAPSGRRGGHLISRRFGRRGGPGRSAGPGGARLQGPRQGEGCQHLWDDGRPGSASGGVGTLGLPALHLQHAPDHHAPIQLHPDSASRCTASISSATLAASLAPEACPSSVAARDRSASRRVDPDARSALSRAARAEAICGAVMPCQRSSWSR